MTYETYRLTFSYFKIFFSLLQYNMLCFLIHLNSNGQFNHLKL